MKRPLVTLVLVTALPSLAAAQSVRSYTCSQGNLTRRVEVAQLGAAEVPCEVRYFKEGQTAPQVLWNAQSEAGYCETQARDFVAKLQGLGWVCSDVGSAPANARPQDDTGSVSPGR
jgi:hypothetical protein